MLKNYKMLSHSKLYDVVQHTTISSIDLIIVHKDEVLLGKRNNNPAKGYWFNPGGKVFKLETQQKAIDRILRNECNMKVDNYQLVGVYDHIYNNNFKDDKTKTHYISTCYKIILDKKPFVEPDNQHSVFNFVKMTAALDQEDVHPYVKTFIHDVLKV